MRWTYRVRHQSKTVYSKHNAQHTRGIIGIIAAISGITIQKIEPALVGA